MVYNKTISLIRLISIVLIVICHIFQFFDMVLAQWFNVGVQLFLCISGWLYGQKKIGEITAFYEHRFKKILVPYYLTFIPFGVLLFFFAKNDFNVFLFLRGLLLNATITGAGHLWFIPTILVCYTITPILEAYRDRYVNEGGRSLLIFTVGAVFVTSLFFGAFDRFFNPAWLSCYVLGYALGINETKGCIDRAVLLVYFGCVAFFANGLQIYCSYVGNIRLPGFSVFCNYSHVSLGVFLFLLMEETFEKCNLQRFDRILKISDKCSYYVYLVHSLIILGPFSLVLVTPIISVNLLIVIIGIIVLTCMLMQMEKFVLRVAK